MARIPSAQLFPTDEPLSAAEMIGRDREVVELALALEAGQNKVVAVPRRMGKTSLCEAALEQLDQAGFYTVAVDLWDVSDARELADALIAQTFRNRSLVHRAIRAVVETGSEYRQALHDVARLAADQVGVPQEVTEALEAVLALRRDEDPQRYLAAAWRLPELVAEKDGRRVVLFLDEFQDIVRIGDGLGPHGWEELAKRMRAVFQRSRQVTFLFTGSLEHMMRALFGDARSAFGDFGTFFPLGPIEKGEWRRGLRERLLQDSCEIEDDALEAIIDLGEGHPRVTMLLAQETHLQSVMRQSRLVTHAMVEQGLFDALRSERAKHEQNVERIRGLGGRAVNRRAFPLVRAIARGEGPYKGKGASPTDVSRPLEALRDAGFIERDDRGWRVLDPLFARYLRSLDPLQ